MSGTTDSSSVGEPPDAEVLVNGVHYGKDLQEARGGVAEGEEGNGRQVPPMLVGTVVAAASAASGEARRTAARLERMAREFQREWARELDVGSEPATVAGSGEDG